MILDYSGGPNIMAKFLKGKQGDQNQRRCDNSSSETGLIRRGHEPRELGSL